ncbi:MAG: hypothetical protein OMM_12363 [Candidatus Magnetoglobus multicellularis str. Araruama]|uniref:EF-hand domain-containing protein n=1 Tax=Candidatus Magnetoglobus multicellularis str. Araruama TaxID=890399 RepID=A0A1V1NW11_9BACT|nr:MAG: hypothetical protein OMM_12363 [Candidatus Magnetoglobus multicellularis str. Araruama]
MVEKIAISKNGISWEIVDSGINKTIRTVIFANNQFVAAGGDWVGEFVLTSPDAEIWDIHYNCNNLNCFSINSLVYNNGHFVAVKNYGGIFSSDKTINWNSANIIDYSEYPLQKQLFKVYCVNDIFVTVGWNIFISNDGEKWQQSNLKGFYSLYDIVFYKDRLYSVGANNTIVRSNRIYFQDDNSKYDINRNGKIDMQDLIVAIQIISGISKEIEINIDINDLINIIKILTR